MDNLYGDERISSYLDGELSADEQARFEERLAESAELRQLVEELRALRGSLDLLPRYQLEPDFAERMLRRAEQRMLIGGDGGSSGGALRASASGESNAPPQTQPASAELGSHHTQFVTSRAAFGGESCGRSSMRAQPSPRQF